MHFIATYEAYLFLASFLVSLLNIHILWWKNHEKNLIWLLLAMVSIAVYNFFAVLDAASAELSSRIFWSKLIYFGAVNITPFLLLFFINYPHKRVQLNWKIIFGILIVPAASIAAVMTNDFHHLFWTGFVPISGTINGYIFQHGPFYWIAVGYAYLCGIAAILLIYEDMRRFSGIYRSQSLWLLISAAFPLVFSLIYDFRLNPIPGMDILPIGFSFSGLGLVFSVVFLRMFDLVPVSRNLLVENLQDGVVIIDNQSRVVDMNPAARKLFNRGGIKIGDDIEKFEDRYLSALRNQTEQTEVIIQGAGVSHLLFIPSQLLNETGNKAGIMFIIRDMTEIRLVEQALHQSQQRYQSLIEDVLDISTVGICILDKDFNLVWVNQAGAIEWLGNREKLLNQDIRKILLQDFSSDLIENGERLIGEILMSYHSHYFMDDVEIHFRNQDTLVDRWLLYSSRPITVGFFTGGRIEQFIDITEQKLLQNKIELLAITDELTGIYNRRGLMEFSRHDFNRARRTNTQLGVIYFDIDYFKEMNDKYGHIQGDAVLSETIRQVGSCLRDMDTFARYGGDEFVILVPDADLRQSVEIAQRIQKVVSSAPIRIGEDLITVNLSLGIAQIRPQDSLTSLLNRADQAMYRAKQAGRGRLEVCD